MDIDHFDPRKKDDFLQQYENLFLSTRHCNGAKGKFWPNTGDQALGLRYLDPCSEQDYGEHIFEDPQTHKLIGITPAGRYHIRMCDLNADHFVSERRERTEIWDLLRSAVTIKHNHMPQMAVDMAEALRRQAEQMIPEFPPLVNATPA